MPAHTMIENYDPNNGVMVDGIMNQDEEMMGV